MVTDELLHDFLQEAGELLDDVDSQLIDLERSPSDTALLNAVFRGFHTIKGGAGFLQADALVELCHKGENLLDGLRTGKLTLDETMLDAILAATSLVRQMFATMSNGSVPAPADPAVLQQLQDCLDGPVPKHANSGSPPCEAAQETDWEALFLMVCGSGRDAHSRLGHSAARKAVALPEVTREAAVPAVQAESLRVDITRFDQILNLTGEIGLAKNRLMNLQRKLVEETESCATVKTMEGTLRNLSMLVADLQNAVMKARMQQVGRVFQRYVRMARDLGRQLGKNVQLVLEGEATELDKTLLDELNDPLVHLIRNAVDHGIEAPAVRSAAGKPERATLCLGAKQIGDTVVIEIADDGHGIDPALLRQKALEKGLISAHEAALLDEQKSFELIFLPGFSTKTEVSSVSGRGVGMDVVRTNVQRLLGRVKIDSQIGRGTRFSIIVPLTLAILPVLKLRLTDQIFAIPLTVVREIIDMDGLFGAGRTPPEFQRMAGDQIAVVTLAQLLGWKDTGRTAVGVLVHVGSRRVVLAADSIVGRDDVVIKPIQAFRPPGVSGATLSADGEVVLILDLNRLLDPLEEG